MKRSTLQTPSVGLLISVLLLTAALSGCLTSSSDEETLNRLYNENQELREELEDLNWTRNFTRDGWGSNQWQSYDVADRDWGDNDWDGLPDEWEAYYQRKDYDPDADRDNDGLNNSVEYGYDRPAWWREWIHGKWLGEMQLSWSDSDGDGLPDGWEVKHGFNPASEGDRHGDRFDDPDDDGLDNLFEYRVGMPADWNEYDNGTWWNGTNPQVPDTGGDEVPDGVEVEMRGSWQNFTLDRISDPLTPDADVDGDDDGLSNGKEVDLGTDPRDPDSDRDGLRDGFEYRESLDLMVSDSTAPDTDDRGTFWDDQEFEAWSEWINRTEIANWSREDRLTLLSDALQISDYDRDGLNDNLELRAFDTDPTRSDTDGDESSDLEELRFCKGDPRDPEISCTSRRGGHDSDGDGLPDQMERRVTGSSPHELDSDGDGLDDGIEWAAWGPASGRRDFDGDGPFDDDGETSNLLDPDADNDTLLDGVEFGALLLPNEWFYWTMPSLNDTDADGLLESEEDTNGLTLIEEDCQSFSEEPSDILSHLPDRSLFRYDEHTGCVYARGIANLRLFLTAHWTDLEG